MSEFEITPDEMAMASYDNGYENGHLNGFVAGLKNSRESIKRDGPVFRVKPLKWIELPDPMWVAGGDERYRSNYEISVRCMTHWFYLKYFGHSSKHQSLEVAKRIAENHYESEIMKNLTEVELL